MIHKLISRLKIRFNPPKNGDVYLGDPIEFIIGNFVQKAFHGLVDKHGDPIWEVIPSEDCYRLTIESDVIPTYYRCTGEVLCKSVCGTKTKWKRSIMPRRISKETFHDMIVQRRLKKYELI